MPFICPGCHSTSIVKNGKTHNGKQNHKCKSCGRQFVKDPENKKIDEPTKQLVDKLLKEKLPVAAISRVAEVSEPWVQSYIARSESKRTSARPSKERKSTRPFRRN